MLVGGGLTLLNWCAEYKRAVISVNFISRKNQFQEISALVSPGNNVSQIFKKLHQLEFALARCSPTEKINSRSYIGEFDVASDRGNRVLNRFQRDV